LAVSEKEWPVFCIQGQEEELQSGAFFGRICETLGECFMSALGAAEARGVSQQKIYK